VKVLFPRLNTPYGQLSTGLVRAFLVVCVCILTVLVFTFFDVYIVAKKCSSSVVYFE